MCVVPNIKGTIVKHLNTVKHRAKLIQFNAKTTEDLDLMTSLSEHFRANPDEAGANVGVHEQLYRFRVCQAFMFAGVALYKAGMLRSLLERSGHSCTGGNHLSQFIPEVEQREVDLIMDEVNGQYIHSMFDGTSRMGELLNNVLRWCSPDFELVQRLALLMTYEKHLSGAQAARVLTTLYMTTLTIAIPRIIGFGRDSVSANSVSSIGNGEYLGRANAGFRDQGEDTGKVASLGKSDDHVHMRLCAHQFGIEAEVSHTLMSTPARQCPAGLRTFSSSTTSDVVGWKTCARVTPTNPTPPHEKCTSPHHIAPLTLTLTLSLSNCQCVS